MRFFIGVIALAVVSGGAHAAGRIPQDVSDHISRRVKDGDCVGVVLCVVDAQGSCCASEGQAALKSDQKVDEKTVFEIGSITKAFTGVLLADMVERNEVAFDDPVQKYLPAGAKVPSRGGKQITLRDLATHRSGLPRLPDNLEPAAPDNPYADYTENRLLDFLRGYELTRDIGEKYEYSNLGMGLLGHALARRARMSYERLVTERILAPLSMKDTRITLTEGLKSRLAMGHSDGKQVKNWDLDALAGAGALRSTPLDMVTFIEANFTPTDTPISKALRASYKDRLDTTQTGLTIGLGWHIWNKHGTQIIWHNGGTGGYRSFCGFAPDKKLGVVVLTNSDTDLDAVGLHILEPKFELPKVRKTVNVAVDVLEPLLGYYELRPGMVIHITREGDRLFAQLTGQDKYPVFAESESRFFFKVVDAQLSFPRPEGGAVDHLILHQNGDHKAPRLTDYKPPERKEITVDPNILEQYVGKYELAPGILFDVKLEAGQLKVMLTGQPRFPVFAESPNKFFYKVVEAQLTFVRDDSGKVTSLILHQGGMDQTAKRMD